MLSYAPLCVVMLSDALRCLAGLPWATMVGNGLRGPAGPYGRPGGPPRLERLSGSNFQQELVLVDKHS